MREPLQDFGDSQYERPNQRWICGLSDEGHACPAGPNPRGRCPALAHCHPIRVGDRWQCNRSPQRGGPCEEGPGPDGSCTCVDRCRPMRSLRSRRGRAVLAATMFISGVLLMVLSSDWRQAAMKPGPLAQNHAHVLASRTGSQRCATCHEAAGGNFGTWVNAAFWHSESLGTQSALCLDCHHDLTSADSALKAHNLPPSQLDQLTANHGGGTFRLSNLVTGSPTNHRGEIACASCHREHHGAQSDLTAIDNNACQACHVERYDSFAGDHPNFGLWPYQRRSRIVFDHAAHQGKHFPQQQAKFDCAGCHIESESQDAQLLAGYEQSCAACHDDGMAASMGQGIAVLALPMIDTQSLSAAGATVGEWPEMATGEFDGRVPPLMKLLLAGDSETAEAMRRLGNDFEFADVDPDDPEQVLAASRIAAASKRLLSELALGGRQVAGERLAETLYQPTAPRHADLLLAGLSADTARAAQQQWLPGLENAEGAGQAAPATNEAALAGRFHLAPAGSWSRDDITFTLQYQPAGHADPLLTTWLTLLVESVGKSDDPLLAHVLDEMSQPTAAGQCISCHSIERRDSSTLTVNWKGLDASAKAREFTRFTHRPHLIQPQLADCTHCHQIDESSNSAVSYNDRDPHTFVSDFMPVDKQQCAGCHTPQAAGDSCQACHHYHVTGTVGDVAHPQPPRIAETPLIDSRPANK